MIKSFFFAHCFKKSTKCTKDEKANNAQDLLGNMASDSIEHKMEFDKIVREDLMISCSEKIVKEEICLQELGLMPQT